MTNQPDLLINGSAADSIPVADRGLQYGDGVFETMAFRDNSIRFLDQHLARLDRGCAALGLLAPDHGLLFREIARLTVTQGSCVIKLIVTRGSSGWGYAPGPDNTAHTRILQRLPWPKSGTPSDGLKGAVLTTTLGSNRLLAGIKHLNRLEQVLAAREVQQRGLDEGLLCDQNGFIMEAVSSNVVLVLDGRIVTPKLDTAGVHGVMLEVIIEKLRLAGVEVHQEFVYADTLSEADEIVLCNSIRGVRRLSTLGETRFGKRAFYDQVRELIA